MRKFFKKISNLSPGVKASISLFIASILTKGLSFITTPIFTRLLSHEVFGQVSVYYSWLQLFAIVATFCLSYGVFNVGLFDNPEKRDELSFSYLILSNIFTIAFAGIFFCFYPLFKSYLNIVLPALILMMVFFLFQPAYLFWLARQKFEYKYKLPLLWAVISSALSIAAPIILIVVCKNPDNNFYYRVFGSEVVLILIHIGFYIYLGVKAKFKLDVSFWKSALLFNLPLIPHYLSMFVLSSSDKIMISYLVSEEATAFYSVAYSIATIALIIWNAIDASLMPYTFKKLKEEDCASINKVVVPILIVFAVGCFSIILLGPEMVWLMGSKGYKEAAVVIPPVVGGIFFQIQYFLYSNVLYYYKKPRFVMFGSVLAALLNLVLNYFCIKQFGYIAAAFTTLGCYFLQALIDFIAMRKVAKKNVYNLPLLIGVSAVVTVVSICGSMLYSYQIVRYVILGIFLLLIAIFSNKIIKVFSQMKESQKDA